MNPVKTIYFKLVIHLYPSCHEAIKHLFELFLKYDFESKNDDIGYVSDMDEEISRRTSFSNYKLVIAVYEQLNCVKISEFMENIKDRIFRCFEKWYRYYKNRRFLAEPHDHITGVGESCPNIHGLKEF